jgi:cell division septation protein DedD
MQLNQRGASSWDLVLKILSITLVSLFAFSSGVWFGKKLSDSDHQRMALEGEFDKEVRKSASTDEHDANADDHDALNDEEVAAAADKALESSRTKTEVAEKAEAAPAHGEKDAHGAPAVAANSHEAPAKATSAHGAVAEKSAPAHAPEKSADKSVATKMTSAPAETAHGEKAISTRGVASTSAATSAAASAKPDLSAVHQAANRVANNAAPVAKEKPAAESRVPSSLPKTVGAANDVEFTVQVASYPTADAAKEHVDAMVKKGFPAFPVEAKINGKTWYRVSVGSFKSFNDASKFRAQLLKQADLPSAIVQKIAR